MPDKIKLTDEEVDEAREALRRVLEVGSELQKLGFGSRIDSESLGAWADDLTNAAGRLNNLCASVSIREEEADKR